MIVLIIQSVQKIDREAIQRSSLRLKAEITVFQ